MKKAYPRSLVDELDGAVGGVISSGERPTIEKVASLLKTPMKIRQTHIVKFGRLLT